MIQNPEGIPEAYIVGLRQESGPLLFGCQDPFMKPSSDYS